MMPPTLQEKIEEIVREFGDKFGDFDDLFPTESNGHTPSEVDHFGSLESFLRSALQEIAQAAREEVVEEQKNALPELIEEHFPKGDPARGRATVVGAMLISATLRSRGEQKHEL